jgi:hypothetical protein
LPAIALFITFSTKILIDEHEIILKNIIKQKALKWTDIKEIERVRRLCIWRGENPKDLKIASTAGAKIFVYGYLKDYDQAIKDIEQYSRKAIGTLKYYAGSGYFIHKKTYLYTTMFLGIGLLCVLILYYYYHYPLKTVLLSCLPLSVLAFYIAYMDRKAQVRISFTDEGIIYEYAKQIGLRFKRVSTIIPLESIISVKMVNEKKGPVEIETSKEDYLLWSYYDDNLNSKVIEEIKRRKQ